MYSIPVVIFSVSHHITQITTGDILFQQFHGNHPFLKIYVNNELIYYSLYSGKEPCPMVIAEIFRNGPYLYGKPAHEA